MTTWTSPAILQELCSDERRTEILETFWKTSPAPTRAAALQLLAQAMKFRLVTLKKAPPKQKAQWALRRLRDPDLSQVFREAILAWHLEHARGLMGACLDAWGIAHEEGVVDSEDYTLPSAEDVETSLAGLRESHADADLALYFAAAGLVMGEERAEWRERLWPLVARLRPAADDAEAP